MATKGSTAFRFDNTFARDLPSLCEPWQVAVFPAPSLTVLNESLARELGVDPDVLRAGSVVESLVGHPAPAGAEPVAQVYSGHQFGNFNPRLGDGRALLLGEIIDIEGCHRDLHLKGSGRTPFARGGDGKAALGPMLREYVIGEAMHGLGIPTTRALAVIATGEFVQRETPLPGAVLARVAASHVRVGTFEYASRSGDVDLLRRLADYVIQRHYPEALDAENAYLALYAGAVDRQAALVARWMLVGFVHGVMNTDNMTLSGESLDFGPCAFMDGFNPETVFSSIDHGGRYAYGNQPAVAQWNLARLGETLLPLIGESPENAAEAATDVLCSFRDRYDSHHRAGLRRRLGLDAATGVRLVEADALGAELLTVLESEHLDLNGTFRSLASSLRDGVCPVLPAPWLERWRDCVLGDGRNVQRASVCLDAVNPLYVPRNHEVDVALTAAVAGDLAPFSLLVEAVSRPYEERPGLERFAQPAPPEFTSGFRTYCGT